MKKVYLFTASLLVSICLNAQQIKNLEVAEVLASDDFEDDTPWVNFDSQDFNHALNNALGGTQEYSWSDAWGGAAVHEGKSATAGKNCMQVHWGGSVILQGFEIDSEKIYQLEVMVHPQGGLSGEWNNWGAVHLFLFDNSNVWQSQGMKIRVSNNESNGGSPALLAYDVWSGDEGTESAHNLSNFSDQWAAYTIDDANDGSSSFWIPLKVIFTGEGTESNPFIIDFYLNDKFIETATVTDLVWKGDAMIGLQNGGDNPDVSRYDNFKLSVLKSGSTIIESDIESDISVVQIANGDLEINSDIYGNGVEYRLYNISGKAIAQGKLINSTTNLTVGTLSAGVYLLQVKDTQSGVSKTVRTIVK